MITHLDDIVKFSQCPRRFLYLKEAIPVPEDRRLFIAKSTIKKAYNSFTETGHLVDWRRIIGWVDTQVFKETDVTNSEAFQAARTTSEQILSFIQAWYHTIYVNERFSVFTDLSMEAPAGPHTIEAKLPIIRASDPPSIAYIDDKVIPFAKIYNDIKARGLAYILHFAFDSDLVEVQHIIMKPRGAFEIEQALVDREENRRTRAALSQIAESMRYASYPSVTQQCYECAFKRKCRL